MTAAAAAAGVCRCGESTERCWHSSPWRLTHVWCQSKIIRLRLSKWHQQQSIVGRPARYVHEW